MSQPHTTNNNHQEDSQLHGILSFLVCGIAASFYIYEFLIRVMPSVMTDELMNTFNIETGALGFIVALFFWGYTPLQIPVGLLYDRFGPRTLLSLSILVCSLATLLFGYTSNVYLASFARLMMGCTGAFAFIGALVTASRWFPSRYFALYAGIVQFLGCIGSIIGQTPVSIIKAHIGWRDTIFWIAVVGFIFAALNWLIIRDHPDNPKAKRRAAKRQNTSTQLRLGTVLKNPQTWWVGVAGFCTWTPVTIFATLWGLPFLTELYHVSITHATYMNDWFWLGIAIGSPIVGWWSNKINHRKLPLYTCFIIGFICSVGVIYGGAIATPLMDVLLFCFGFAASAQTISFGLVMDNNTREVLGTAFGFNNMAVIIGGILFQPIVGYILQVMTPNIEIANHHANDSAQIMHAFHWALAAIPFIYILGIFVTKFLVKETHCQSVVAKS